MSPPGKFVGQLFVFKKEINFIFFLQRHSISQILFILSTKYIKIKKKKTYSHRTRQNETRQTWDKTNMRQDKHETRQTWDKTNMRQDKHETIQTWDKTNIEEDKHETRQTWDNTNMRQDKHETRQTWDKTNIRQ